jgi:general stress protein 26
MTETIDKQAQIEAILTGEPLIARLATVNPKTLQPHITMVWFLWDGTSLWISAFISTRKAKDISKNQKVAVLLEPKDEKPFAALLFEGECEFIAEPRELVTEMALKIYERYMGPEGVKAKEPQSWAVDAENRLIKLTPARTFTW